MFGSGKKNEGVFTSRKAGKIMDQFDSLIDLMMDTGVPREQCKQLLEFQGKIARTLGELSRNQTTIR